MIEYQKLKNRGSKDVEGHPYLFVIMKDIQQFSSATLIT